MSPKGAGGDSCLRPIIRGSGTERQHFLLRRSDDSGYASDEIEGIIPAISTPLAGLPRRPGGTTGVAS